MCVECHVKNKTRSSFTSSKWKQQNDHTESRKKAKKRTNEWMDEKKIMLLELYYLLFDISNFEAHSISNETTPHFERFHWI